MTRVASVFLALFGVLLPATTLGIELATRMCAEAFFDPIPTLGHILLVALVPLANAMALIEPLRQSPRWRRRLFWLNGVALGVALFYTVVFLPLTPLAVIAIIYFGFGFLPLSPLCALICGVALRYRLTRAWEDETVGDETVSAKASAGTLASLVWGGTIGILLCLAAESPMALTRMAAKMAVSDSPDQQMQGIRWLRLWGNRDELLRMCHGGATGTGSLFGPGGGSKSISGIVFRGVPDDEAQRVFFRVTGTTYDSTTPNDVSWPLGRRGFEFDPNQGGETVGRRRTGLSLCDSRLDATVHADAAMAYVEWTMTFRNNSPSQREARAQVALPPGGVVSRVTLWIGGEPREAVFAGTGQVREAYKKVAVQQRRDPLLVTWAGDDRVLVQCFPVPPYGEMKIRLGVIAPLTLTDAQRSVLRLPCFLERNFSVGSQAIHSLWCQSDVPCHSAVKALQCERQDGRHVGRARLTESQLSGVDSCLTLSQPKSTTECWASDPQDAKKIVMQKVVAVEPSPKRSLVVVIDGSLDAAGHFDAIAESLAALPGDIKLDVLVAGDEVLDGAETLRTGRSSVGLSAWLRNVAGKGGCDNVAALLKAIEKARKSGDAVVWIHAPQPVLCQSMAPIAQWLEHGEPVVVYDFATATGPNRLVEKFGLVRNWHSVPRVDAVQDDLRTLFSKLAGQAKEYRLERSRLEEPPPKTPKSSSQLARLWALDRVLALTQTGSPADRKAALKLAATYQLVTPVSGAVVLETKQQYDEAKLKPVDPQSTPNTPEPAVWVLVFTAAPWLAWHVWRRRLIRVKES
ncbi:MAG: VIT domain-containing protein [Thermoguttaceae bacterium]